MKHTISDGCLYLIDWPANEQRELQRALSAGLDRPIHLDRAGTTDDGEEQVLVAGLTEEEARQHAALLRDGSEQI